MFTGYSLVLFYTSLLHIPGRWLCPGCQWFSDVALHLQLWSRWHFHLWSFITICLKEALSWGCQVLSLGEESKIRNSCLCIFFCEPDTVQDMISQNMSPWYIISLYSLLPYLTWIFCFLFSIPLSSSVWILFLEISSLCGFALEKSFDWLVLRVLVTGVLYALKTLL